MVKLNRKLCEDTRWGEQKKSPTAEFYTGEVCGRVFGGVNGFMSVSDWFPDTEHSASWMGKWHLFSRLVWENIWCHLEAQTGARCSPVIRLAQQSCYITASW